MGVEEMSSNWVGERVAKLPKERLEELCAMSEEEVVVSRNSNEKPEKEYLLIALKARDLEPQ